MKIVQFQYANTRKRRMSPTHNVLVLRQAVEAVGLKVMQYEDILIPPGEMYPISFHVSILYRNRIAYIHSVSRQEFIRRRCLKSPKNGAIFKRRVKFCTDYGIPYLEVIPGTIQFVRAQIELWLMLLKQTPIRIARDHDYDKTYEQTPHNKSAPTHRTNPKKGSKP